MDRPIYWVIGEIVEEEYRQFENWMFLKEKQTSQAQGRTIGELQDTEYKQLWEALEGYRELGVITQWAMMLEETDGEVEKHPDYIATFDEPLLGTSISGWSNATFEAEQHLLNQRILQSARNDSLGRGLLRFKEERLERQLKETGEDPDNSGRMIGFKQAMRRYDQILDYLLQNEIIS